MRTVSLEKTKNELLLPSLAIVLIFFSMRVPMGTVGPLID